ncbi:hypothetical protein ACT453_53260, partial [Bacillus sp. D-CC]
HVIVEDNKKKQQTWVANFVVGCTGYYNYDQGYAPTFPNQEAFKGQLIHPQHWPENLDYKGKKVVQPTTKLATQVCCFFLLSSTI